MPHSSGGGSHSGGFHGSRGGSSRSSSERSGPRSSNQYFAGSHRYVYYYGARPHYYFTDTPPSTRKRNLYIKLIPALLILLALLIYLGTNLYSRPRRILEAENARVSVEDSLDLFTASQEESLTQTLSDFLSLTGITPVVITEPNSSWEGRYSSLEKYAYDLYVNRFSDEKHWLLIYTQPEETPEDGWVDWHWEGMQGDDTDPVLTQEKADAFTKALQRRITQEHTSLSDALLKSFEELSQTIMNPVFDGELFATFLIILGLGSFMIVSMVISTLDQNRKAQSVRLSTDTGEVLEDTCSYCGGLYVHGLHTACPHCGAPLTPKA